MTTVMIFHEVDGVRPGTLLVLAES